MANTKFKIKQNKTKTVLSLPDISTPVQKMVSCEDRFLIPCYFFHNRMKFIKCLDVLSYQVVNKYTDCKAQHFLHDIPRYKSFMKIKIYITH